MRPRLCCKSCSSIDLLYSFKKAKLCTSCAKLLICTSWINTHTVYKKLDSGRSFTLYILSDIYLIWYIFSGTYGQVLCSNTVITTKYMLALCNPNRTGLELERGIDPYGQRPQRSKQGLKDLRRSQGRDLHGVPDHYWMTKYCRYHQAKAADLVDTAGMG
jgi:hypothetical protein